MSSPAEAHCARMKIWYASSKTSGDFVICCQDMRFPVHKAVLSSQSDYFNSMFQRDWKENAQGEVELKEDVSFVVEAMIQFMYYADYERPAIESYDYEFEFLFDAQVYVIAEKYGLPDLKQRAQEKFSSQQTYEPGETRFTSKIAYFSEAVEVIFNNTPPSDPAVRDLRNMMTELAVRHISDFLKCPDFNRVLGEIPEFGASLVKDLARQVETLTNTKMYQCSSCDGNSQAILDNRPYYPSS